MVLQAKSKIGRIHNGQTDFIAIIMEISVIYIFIPKYRKKKLYGSLQGDVVKSFSWWMKLQVHPENHGHSAINWKPYLSA